MVPYHLKFLITLSIKHPIRFLAMFSFVVYILKAPLTGI